MILTGADPAFCAGLDLKELGSSGGNLRAGNADGSASQPGQHGPFPPMEKPVIGAVNGVAITGGFELALNCDFLVASERARFGDTHTRVGVMPGWGLTVLLPQAIGVRRAREMSFTGNFLDAARGLAVGPRQPRRAPRRAAAVQPAASPPTSSATTSAACARSARPTTRSRRAPSATDGTSSAATHATGSATRASTRPRSSAAAWRSSSAAAPRPDAGRPSPGIVTRRWRRRGARCRSGRRTRCSDRGATRRCGSSHTKRRALEPRRAGLAVGAALREHTSRRGRAPTNDIASELLAQSVSRSSARPTVTVALRDVDVDHVRPLVRAERAEALGAGRP